MFSANLIMVQNTGHLRTDCLAVWSTAWAGDVGEVLHCNQPPAKVTWLTAPLSHRRLPMDSPVWCTQQQTSLAALVQGVPGGLQQHAVRNDEVAQRLLQNVWTDTCLLGDGVPAW